MVYDSGDFFGIPHKCSVFEFCILNYDKGPMRIYFCSFCRRVIGYLKDEENKIILDGQAVTGCKQNELDEKTKQELI